MRVSRMYADVVTQSATLAAAGMTDAMHFTEEISAALADRVQLPPDAPEAHLAAFDAAWREDLEGGQHSKPDNTD